MKRLFLACFAASLAGAAVAYERLQGPTGVQYWDRALAQTGYTFLGAGGAAYLVDMDGRVAHAWPVGTLPRLLDNGHVLGVTNASASAFRTMVEADWDGAIVWSHTETRTNYAPHADFLRIRNPKLGAETTLYLANKSVTHEQAIAAGCVAANGPYTNAQVDAIVEVDASGAVVWEWCFFDHGIQNADASKSNYVGSGKTISDYPGRINLNLAGRPLGSNWLDCVSLDFNTNLDQIVVAAEGGEFYVIDHGNTFLAGNPSGSIALAAGAGGDFLYRFGDPARYGAGTAPSVNVNWTTSTTGQKQIGGVGRVEWIQDGLPGAGRFLVFNCGQDLFETTPQSYLFEVNGRLNSSSNDTGAYVSPPSAGYFAWAPPGHDTDKRSKSMSRQIVAMYYSMANQGFFSHLGGSAQRLANSNTLVCSAAEGHVFEVTPAGAVVWEFVSPVTPTGTTSYKRDEWPGFNRLDRATRYVATHAALTGRTLVATATLDGAAPAYISAPLIAGTARDIGTPASTQAVWVSAWVTNAGSVASVSLTRIAGGVTNTSSMVDDGAHGDGAPGDGRFGAQIPAHPGGTAVRYFVVASDDFANTATDPAGAPANAYAYTVASGPTNAFPYVGSVGVAAVTGTALRVTALVTDDVSVASVTLYYSIDAAAAATNTVFLETMRTTPINPWTGDGCDHAWSLTYSGSNPFNQRGGAHYGSGNTNGMEFKQGTVNFTDSVATCATAIDARGTGATLDLWTQTPGLSGVAGWALQLNSGTGWVTRAAESNGVIHGWQRSAVDLPESDRVSNLTMRILFRGGASTNRIDVDRIAVATIGAGTVWSNLTMLDDGAHGDGAAGDGVFGVDLPAQAAGTVVRYYVAAADGSGATTSAPSGAPGTNSALVAMEPPNVVLGRPTDTSIALNALVSTDALAYVEYGATGGAYGLQTAVTNLPADVPVEIEIAGLATNTAYAYRLRYRTAAEGVFRTGPACSFRTRRASGATFSFCLQGDSHPERTAEMFDADLYRRALATAAADAPDFFLTIGDDFSVDTIPTNLISAALVTGRYAGQRPYLGMVGASSPLFLVNGNHEQAAAYLLDGTSNNIAVWAQTARNRYYPQPAPDGFYTGNTNVVPHIGLLRNFFAWTWGDALFVTIDPYWASTYCVDNDYWGGEKRTNMWDISHGDAQYQWLKTTLEQSTARYKFVFAHHVMGTGRGGVELADLYEWGGRNGNGTWGFTTNRPTWSLPIHQLMATQGVSVFFQGHDHIFAQQQLDGVTYLTLPVPADPTYTLWNADAFTEGLLYKTNGSGYVRVTVSPDQARVDYVRAFLPADEGPGRTNGMVDHSFTIAPLAASSVPPAIASVTNAPAVPVAGRATWVTARIADDTGVSSATLYYRAGSGAAVTNVAFLETMGATPSSSWSGGGCDQPWTVTFSSTNPFSQEASANYGAGNTNGLTFTKGTTSFLNSMIASATNIDARGTNGVVGFWLRTSGLGGTAGWAFQVNAGEGFVTQIGEMSGLNHDWQLYQYELAASELVSNLQLRFQFRGGASSNQISLDRISVATVTAAAGWTPVAMADDGAHGDGASGDGIYGASIPAQPVGTAVSYFIAAADAAGLVSTNPAGGADSPASWVTGEEVTFDALLGRPTDQSVAVSVLASGDIDIYGEFGTSPGAYTAGRSVTNRAVAGTPSVLSLDGLAADTAYYYRLQIRSVGATGFSPGLSGVFHTQRAATNAFTFDIEADPHYLDPNGVISPVLWGRALTNMLADAPDFLIDLGDTFMTEKLGVTNQSVAAQLCRDVRSILFGPVGHSMPLFLVNGNHEAELGWLRSSPTVQSNIAVWSTQERQRYFPCPVPGSFYSGATNIDTSMLAPRDSYYSFTWGNALFVVLDPFWATATKPGAATCWNWTLGTHQYEWLRATLATNRSTFKFVFIHHLVGGSFDGAARGGVEYAPYFEWGGRSSNGTPAFATQRSGWAMPIQDLLLSNGVDAVFHGHDHLYVKQDLDANGDGIADMIYQECPQPDATNYNTIVTAAGYGYTNGTVQGNSGHLRVRVTPTNATVEYVRAYLAASEGSGKTNGMVTHAYTLQPVMALAAARSVSAPTAADAVWVTASALGGSNLAQVALVYDAGAGAVTVAMADDGAHGDGAAGDGRYGAQIPALPGGTAVSYVIRTQDALGRTRTEPASGTYAYTVAAAAAAGWSMLALPDTGQTSDYSVVFGEDSDYAIHPPALTNNGDGTVSDLVTGLMWQQADGGEMTWDAGTNYAAGLSLGGHDDWRLPTAHEAYSILNQGTLNPALDTNRFTTSAAEYWWTRDLRVGDTSRAWAINAGGGIGPHPKSETISAGGTKRFHVRCVRGASAPAATGPIHRLTNAVAGTVTDLDTGLMWQRVALAPTNWDSALAVAENLTLGGFSDWRLPNVKEIRSINDESLASPSLDTNYFTGAASGLYWASTTMAKSPTNGWFVDQQYGLTSQTNKTAALYVRCVRGGTTSSAAFTPSFARIPAGEFEMGDHFGFVDPLHPSDEVPVHTVRLSAFSMATTLVTCREYCDYLNAALAAGLIEIRSNLVYGAGTTNVYCDTYTTNTPGRIGWDGAAFTVLDGRELHPVTGIRRFGALGWCNWASARDGLTSCYDLASGVCAFTNAGYRLPTEAEWEYAARGGLHDPYMMFPWGNETNADGRIANWAGSGDPYESGTQPWTTPVGFYDGSLRRKADFGWPGTNDTYQTRDGVNGYGLYDMSGNVWQWIEDWYRSDYYTTCAAAGVVTNPTGPASGGPMPDGQPYRGMRGGNWYNGQDQYGHGRVANRDPSYFRGPGDPNGPWFHVGFRVVRAFPGVVDTSASVTQLVTGLSFAEGPAADAAGDLYFSDPVGDRIHRWTAAAGASVYRTNTAGANGLFVDGAGRLIACEGDGGRLVAMTSPTNVTALVSDYNGTRFNEPNDLWIAPSGGIYFTDPVYFGHPVVQSGEHAYYLKPDRSAVVRVVADLVRPNGLIGTADGATLYVADWGAGIVYRYAIQPDGSLTGKTAFASVACDGMTIDTEGNVYLCGATSVLIYDAGGRLIDTIAMPERPTNATFGGADRRTLFVTTEAGRLYARRTLVAGAAALSGTTNVPPSISGVSRTLLVPTPADAVKITATVTDDSGTPSVSLYYTAGATSATTNTVFLETMATAPAKPWSGTGCDRGWTVVGSNYLEQRGGANYGAGNTNGLEFKQGTTNLTDATITSAAAFDARGASGSVEFWMQTLGMSGTAGWTFQLDAGSGFVTRAGELSAASHGWQRFAYALDASELTSNLTMRFQFRGGAVSNRINLDRIAVTVLAGGATYTSAAMLDDGAHGDGAAGDGTYAATIPEQSAGTTVGYYVAASDGAGGTAVDPVGAPATNYTYTVQAPVTNVTQTVGLFLHDRTNAWPGYTLMAPMHQTNTYLLNNDGQFVHSWTSTYEPGRACYLLENGHMIRACMVRQGGPSTGGGEGGRIEEYDWSGNLVWAIDYYSPNYIHHHDFKVLPNGNVLLLVAEKKTLAEVIAAGFNTNLLDAAIFSDGYMLPDCLVEVTPTKPYGGTVVWEWHLWDHMIQDYSATKSSYGVVADHPELIDVNGTGIKIPQFWNHVNGIDYNPALDQVMLSIRGNSELFVIDHQLTTAQAAGHTGGRYGKGGDILYRWGFAQQYDRAPAAARMLYQQHHTHWIEPGLPGAGNILIFNNGIGRGYSTVDEITPPVNSTGVYALATGAAYGPTTNTWRYIATPPTNFYSSEISGAERLPNGNTLICSGIFGTLFEVTPAGQTVWRYVCPVTTTTLTQGASIPIDAARTDQWMNAVFRVTRYPTNYAGLAGKDLTPRGTIEDYAGVPADADGDGLRDAWETNLYGSVFAISGIGDADGDGLSNRQEHDRGLHPGRADTDGDGMPDGWEAARSFDPAWAADGGLDSDGDGTVNGDEYTADTDPRNAGSQLRIATVEFDGVGVRVAWTGGTNAWQRVEYHSNLANRALDWVPLVTNLPPTASTNSVILDGVQGGIFFRVRAGR